MNPLPPGYMQVGTLPVPETPALELVVVGVPAPQGSKKGYVRGGRVVMVESSAKVKPWRQSVAYAAREAVTDSWEPLDGPLVLDMVFTMPRPASAPKKVRAFAKSAPDLSKLLRATEDALDTDANVIANDSRIVAYRHLGKYLAGDVGQDVLPHPGAVIRIWQVDVAASTGR